MAYAFPEGAKFFFSTSLAAAKTLATMSNANPCVCGSVAHGYVDNDELLISSGWEDATDTVFKADQLTADTFSLLGLDTTNTGFYSAGGGANSTAQKISGWTEIPQVLSVSAQGGGPRYANFNPLAERNGRRQIIGFEPASLDLTLGHDPTNATQKEMAAITRAFTKVAIKIAVPGGGRIYGYGNMAASEVPRMSPGNPNSIAVGISFDGRLISYGS